MTTASRLSVLAWREGRWAVAAANTWQACRHRGCSSPVFCTQRFANSVFHGAIWASHARYLYFAAHWVIELAFRRTSRLFAEVTLSWWSVSPCFDSSYTAHANDSACPSFCMQTTNKIADKNITRTPVPGIEAISSFMQSRDICSHTIIQFADHYVEPSANLMYIESTSVETRKCCGACQLAISPFLIIASCQVSRLSTSQRHINTQVAF